MKTKFRLTSLLLSFLLLTSLFGCSMPGIGEGSREDTSTNASTTVDLTEEIKLEENTAAPDVPDSTDIPAETEPVPDTSVFVPETTVSVPETTVYIPETTDIPYSPSLDFGGETVRILYASDAERNEFNPEESGDIIDDYIYLRNKAVEERLNIKFEWTGMEANASKSLVYLTYAEHSSNAGEPFDIYAATRRAMGLAIEKSLIQDLNLIQKASPYSPDPLYLHDHLKVDMTIGGADFLVTGDISANALLQMNAIFYNTQLAENFGYGDIGILVPEGLWTLDKLIELSSGVYVDFDGDGRKSPGDRYGFTQSTYVNNDAFYSGSGLKFFDSDPTGDLYIKASADMTSEKSAYLNDKLFSFFKATDSYTSDPTIANNYSLNPFIEENSLFCHSTLSFADKGGKFSEPEFKYGILPIPKYDEKQEEYITTLSNQAVFWGIHNYNSEERITMSAAVIEARLYEGHTNVAPAVFENVLKQRYMFSDYREIFDLMRASVRVDFGKLFAHDTAELPTMFARSITSSANHWIMSAMNSQTRAQIQRSEKELNRAIEYALTNQN